MNLTSCDKCGVILDRTKLNFPEDIIGTDGAVDSELAVWYDPGEEFVAKVSCPVCGGDILDTTI